MGLALERNELTMPSTGRAVRAQHLLKGKTWSDRDLKAKIFIFSAALLIMAATVALTVFLIVKGLHSFLIDGISVIEMFVAGEWNPNANPPSFGALPLLFGSFAVTLLSVAIATPIALGTAIFMTEIAKKRGQKLMRPVMELLVGIPSVVYGFIGLTVIVPFIRDHLGGIGFGLLAAGIVLGIMILPTVTTVAADAFQSVPNHLREASLALGATRWQTIYRVVVPAALPSVLTAVILGMARAFGEALAVQMVIGNTAQIPHSLTEPAATLTTMITSSLGETTYGSLQNDALWSLGLILLAMSYLFILVIRFLSYRRRSS